MSRRAWAWGRLLGGVAVLSVLAWRVGAGPFIEGVTAVGPRALAAAVIITGFTTVCCAWRWRLIAGRLGAGLHMRTAIARYYLSQFLNSTLPGGILGDVHRGARHGRDSGDVGLGLRATAWDRIGGQTVQLALTLVLLTALPSPVREFMPVVVAVVVAAAALVVVVLARSGRRRARPGGPRSDPGGLRSDPSRPRSGPGARGWWARMGRIVAADVRHGLLARGVWPGVAVSSAAATLGHLAVFLIAAQAVGVSMAPGRMIGLGLLTLAAMSVPLNIAGWGPREGVAAWAFAAAGLGAGQGIAVAVAYGVLSLAACLPGAVVLVFGRRSTAREPETVDEPTVTDGPQTVPAGSRGIVRG